MVNIVSNNFFVPNSIIWNGPQKSERYMSSRSCDTILSDLNKGFFIFNMNIITVIITSTTGNAIPTVIYKQDKNSYGNRLFSSEYLLKETMAFMLFENRQSLISINTSEALFNYWYREWYEKIKYQSSIDNIISDPYFKEIINLGYSVIPYIINVLKKTPSHLFVALCEITGENPIKPENCGKTKEMVNDWIEWWEEKSHAME